MIPILAPKSGGCALYFDGLGGSVVVQTSKKPGAAGRTTVDPVLPSGGQATDVVGDDEVFGGTEVVVADRLVMFEVELTSSWKKKFGLDSSQRVLLCPSWDLVDAERDELDRLICSLRRCSEMGRTPVIDLTGEPTDAASVFGKESGYSLLGMFQWADYSALSVLKKMYKESERQYPDVRLTARELLRLKIRLS